MMNHHKQTPGIRRPSIEPNRLHQHPSRRRKSARRRTRLFEDARLTPPSIKTANLYPAQAVDRRHRSRLTHLQPQLAASPRHIQPQAQRVMMIKHSLQRTDQIFLAQTRRHLQQHRLVKPIDWAPALQQPAHDWRRHHCASGNVRQHSRRLLEGRGYPSQSRNRLMLKNRTRRDHQTSLARSAHQLDRDNAVATKREEIVVNPNPLNPQHLRKQPAQNLLTRRARQPQTAPPNRRRRQRCAVKLPVRRQRQTFKLNNRRRNHVIRKPRPHVRAQLPSINRTASRRHHIANKLRAPRPFTARNHRSLRHTRMTPQRRTNLPRLNAKTANLHLMVRTTHKLQNSIRPPPRQVPAAVHPSPRSPKPVRNKALPSQPTAANIAATYPTAGYVKLPNYPNSHRLKAIIQNIYAVIRQRTTNRDMRTRLLAFDSKSNGIDRRFRRTVKIGDLLEREAARNLSHKLYRQGLPTQGQMLQRRIGRGTADDRVQVGRHAAHETHLFPDQSMPELRGRLPYRIADNHRRPATDERQHRLLNRGVKSTRDDERRSETAPHVEVLRQAQDLISEACMSDGDALGGSGGA